VEARVVNTGQSGQFQLAVGNQTIDVSAALKLQEGALIRLLVQGSGSGQRLTVLPTPVPATAQPHGQSQQTLPLMPQQSAAPQTQVVRARAQPVAAPPSSSGATAQPPQPTVQGQPTAGQPVAAHSNTVPTRPVVVATNGAGVSQQPLPPAASTATNLSPNQNAAPQPAPGGQQVLAHELQSGTVLRLQTQGAGVNARPVLAPVANPPTAETASRPGPAGQFPLQAVSLAPLQQAITQTVQSAVIRQDSITTLLTTLAGLGAKLANLPKPVAQAGSDLLAARVNLNGQPLDGTALKHAFNRSGVLYESSLLKNTGQTPPKGDIKASLLNLRGALGNWLGGDAESKTPAQNRPPPPTPGAPPRAERPTLLQFAANPPNVESGTRLLGQTDAALARMRLMQISSLPDGGLRAGQTAGGPAELNIELPLLFGGEMSVGQFQIMRDGERGSGRDQNGEWKMRFSINFSQTGEVGVTVALRGGKTHVMLWAEREQTADELNNALTQLEDALEARGLNPGTLQCRMGHPPQGKKPVGVFMDSCS